MFLFNKHVGGLYTFRIKYPHINVLIKSNDHGWNVVMYIVLGDYVCTYMVYILQFVGCNVIF